MDCHGVADRVELAVRRALVLADAVEPLARTAALAELARRLERLRDRAGREALDAGESCAAVGRVLGITRQAARQRLGPSPRR